MSEKDFSKLQADVCDDLPEPLPIKKICPTCIENPNYIEPDWRNTVNQPYLNEATCEYTCVVTINKYGDYYTGLEFRDPPQGREVALREFIEPALRLMLRRYGKLEADQIICAAFPGIKLEGLAPDELLDLQSNYSLAYQRTSENSFTEREIEIGENRGGDPNNPSADISIEERNSCIPIDEVIEDGIPYAGANRTTEEGDSFEVFDATKFATGEYPEITNPYALELYATVKEFDIDPVQNILKVKVVVPAFVFDQVPAAPTVELAAGNASNIQTLNSVEFLSEDHGPQLDRLAKALQTYSSFQSLFWQQQDGYLIFSDTQGVEPLSAEDTQKVDYYASFEQQRIIEYKDKIEQLIIANNFALNRVLSGFGNYVRKIKLEFEEGEVYKLKSVKVEVNGCGYSKLTQGFDDFKEFCDKYPTTMHYVANLKNIDMTLRAQQSYPWLDFLVKYTYPQISVIYGKLSQNSLRESGWECIANNAADYATELRDVILSDTVNLFKALEYEFNNVTCSEPGEKPSVLKEGFFGKSLEDTYQAEFDKFFSQESLLKSLIPPDTLRSMSTNPNSPAIKGLKDTPQSSGSNYAIKMLTLCNVKTIGMASIRCLFSGTTYEDAMAKLIRVALESMNIDVLGFFIENLPPDAQVKIRQQYERDFANLPLPWEAGYDPGSMSNSNPYEKYKDGFQKQIRTGLLTANTLKELRPRLEQAIKSADLAQERVNTLQNRVSVLESELVIAQIDVLAGNADEAKVEGIQNRLKAARSDLAEAQTLYTQLENERIDLQTQVTELAAVNLDPNAKKSDLELWRDLPEEEKKALADAANRQANAPENTPPGTYGNVLGPLQKTITAAYIDYMMDSLQIDVLLETLDRVPLVSELLPRIIASFKCAYKSPQDPALDDFLSTLTLDVCGDLRNGITLPEIPKIPNFFNTSFLKRISDLFELKMTQTLTKVLVSLLFKLLETVDAALCNSLNALGQFVVSGDPDVGNAFDEAFRDAFCPSGDDDDAAATKDNIFGGIGGFGGDIECLYKTLNSVTSKKENIELLAGEGDSNASRRIAEAVNTFCPEYGRVMGSPEDVENFYRQAGSFCPPELLQDLLDQVRQEPEGPVYDSICLTQEELDQFNRDREALLTAGGLDEETARDMIDRANERVLDDLGDVARIMQQGPQGLLDQAIQDLLSRGDPTCSVNKSAITLETPQTRAQKTGLINEFFNPLEKNFFDDLIGEFHSVLGSILRDKSDNNLKLHEFFVNTPFLFPNYHNSESEWDFRKENGSFFYTWMMNEDFQGGFFPDTVGIHLRKEMQNLQTPQFNVNDRLQINGYFNDAGEDGKVGYSLLLDVERKGSLGNDYEIKVTESFRNIFATNFDLDDLLNFLQPIVERSSVYYEKPFTHDESFLEGIEFTLEDQPAAYVQVFENLLKRGLNRPVQISSVESKNVYESINGQIFNFVKHSMLNDPNGNLPVGFKFGYDIDEAISFQDLIYVNPNANPNNPETWRYTFEEEDRTLGKSATENPRVHFLDPDIHGGSYKRPKIYIEPATYNGWLGLVRTFVPEVSSCDENTTNFLDLTQITNRVKEVEDNLPFDERLSLPVECRVELPFDRQFSPVNHGLMEGVVLSTVRVHVTEFILKTLPTFASVEMTSRNIEDYFVDILIEDMKQSMIEQFSLFSVISDYTYWLLFLEQSFQVVERMVLDGMIEMSPALEAAKAEIEAARGQFRSLGQDLGAASIALANGSAIIAYGENWEEVVNDPSKLSLSDVAGIFRSSWPTILTPFRIGLANKINTIYKARDAAKVFLREIVKSEMTLLSDKLNFNMRPRPHIYDINKYFLSRNGITRGSTLRAGESRIEAPVSGGDSGLDYGSIFDVPRNVLEENVFDNLTLSSEEFNKLNESGIFYLERYVRTTDKSGLEQVYNIKEFEEFLNSNVLDRSTKLSDLFGNLELISDDRILLGSLGVQFGVRLMYCPPSAFSYDLTDLSAETNRAFFHKPAMISIEGEDEQRPWPLTARTVPIAVFEQDIIDRKIKDIDFEDENMGQDLKCYIDKLIQTEEYQVFVDYCFPLKSYVSFFATYSFYGFFNSIGVDSSENEDSNLSFGSIDFDIWKGLVFNESKDTCRKLFNSVYRSDDDDPQDDVETSRDSTRKFLEGIIPGSFTNLDSSIDWRQKSRIVKEKPFDADGKDCKNGFQKLFDK